MTVNIKSHHHIPESLGQLHGEQRTPHTHPGVWGGGGGRVGGTVAWQGQSVEE